MQKILIIGYLGRDPELKYSPQGAVVAQFSIASTRLLEALSFRQIGVVREEYAVSADGMKMFGVMDLTSGFQGCRFAIGLRNSHDKSFRLSCTVGLRVFVCENLAFHGEYTPVLAKHSKNFLLEDSLAVGVDRIQRNFGPLKRQVEQWQSIQLLDSSAKLLIYRAFIEDEAGFPKHLARRVRSVLSTSP
jgi:Single-strand binding protein family